MNPLILCLEEFEYIMYIESIVQQRQKSKIYAQGKAVSRDHEVGDAGGK